MAKLLGASNGRILFAAEGGTANAFVVEVLGLDAAEALMVLGKKRDLPLRCAVVHVAVTNGTAKISTFVIDTGDTVVSVEGSANLGKETLNMAARAEPRDTSPFTLRTPVNITGTFSDPKVRPQAGPLAGRAVAAVALATINPLLALIPFADPGGDPEPGCQPQKPAKAPEKTNASK
jgi:AsmA protein